jgi:8-oxo-dGTP pyrophosphatase MutT (NUDIX family)
MHRAPLLRLLAEYAARHPDESDCVGRYTDFVSAHPDCFERSLAIGHVTGAAWILDRSGTRVLLTHHRKLNRWLQPGGHADGDPDVLATASREALEETGLTGLVPDAETLFDLDVHPIPARGDIPEHLHYDARFLFRATGSEDFTVSEESHDLAWVPLGKLEDFTTEESILRLARKTGAKGSKVGQEL